MTPTTTGFSQSDDIPFNEYVKQLRLSKNLSFKALERKTKIHRTVLSELEKRKDINSNPKTLKKLSKFYNIDLEKIIKLKRLQYIDHGKDLYLKEYEIKDFFSDRNPAKKSHDYDTKLSNLEERKLFVKVLKTLRANTNLTGREIGRLIGIPESTISGLESLAPRLKTMLKHIKKIARFYNVDEDILYNTAAHIRKTYNLEHGYETDYTSIRNNDCKNNIEKKDEENLFFPVEDNANKIKIPLNNKGNFEIEIIIRGI